jgi:hypothetical protein
MKVLHTIYILVFFILSSGNSLAAGLDRISPATGRNELVTGGKMTGIVCRVEAFYPLPLVNRNNRMSSVYLFGSTQMRLTQANPTFLSF